MDQEVNTVPPPVPNTQSSKNTLVYVIIIIIALMLLAMGSYVLYNIFNQPVIKKAPIATPITTPKRISSPTITHPPGTTDAFGNPIK